MFKKSILALVLVFALTLTGCSFSGESAEGKLSLGVGRAPVATVASGSSGSWQLAFGVSGTLPQPVVVTYGNFENLFQAVQSGQDVKVVYDPYSDARKGKQSTSFACANAYVMKSIAENEKDQQFRCHSIAALNPDKGGNNSYTEGYSFTYIESGGYTNLQFVVERQDGSGNTVYNNDGSYLIFVR